MTTKEDIRADREDPKADLREGRRADPRGSPGSRVSTAQDLREAKEEGRSLLVRVHPRTDVPKQKLKDLPRDLIRKRISLPRSRILTREMKY